MSPSFDPSRLSDVVDAMYAMVSGPAGPRDWTLQEKVFHPEARQMRTGVDADGKPWIRIMTLDDYAADTTPFFAVNDFFEVEVGRRVQQFGNMAHVWSVYEARKAPDDDVPERRGINSIQLFRNAVGHWQITSMIWDNERPGVAVDWSL
ncbi:hypothetical protein [Dokdonella immobilis]|uniref:DUF4440 domain-containing protein n=1 Tax=Dokdonella immobilis TaxID=578942 RepID=A0A1I5AAQ5_9GAMM|nr:hypothetical protein [Dokdonella immobilis]SFN59448.1 hypothetical protein SAMN05216289_13429 [Dokdonella immobilis]